MTLAGAERVTIDQVDQSRSLEEWKPRLADRGRRRHLSYSMDFDTRAHLLREPGEGWEPEVRKRHLENRKRLEAELAAEFGSDNIEAKIANFKEIGVKPLSIRAYHNQFFDQSRRAFVIGAYYPALLAACALGERILNHLILDLREFYKHTPAYKRVARKESFDNWNVPIEVLQGWGVLLPKAASEFKDLMLLRHRSIHFDVRTYSNLRDDALAAILHMREIISQQFATWGGQPWFISGTKGHLFFKREWENDPFIKTYYLPRCPFVGPWFSISFKHGLRFHDHRDYGDGEWSDEEFAAAYESRTSEQLAKSE